LLYWHNPQGAAIGRDRIDNSFSDPGQTFLNTGTDQLYSLRVAVDRQYVYCTNSLGISRANLDGTSVVRQFMAYAGAVPSESSSGLACTVGPIHAPGVRTIRRRLTVMRQRPG
jgi:hypothetical protein